MKQVIIFLGNTSDDINFSKIARVCNTRLCWIKTSSRVIIWRFLWNSRKQLFFCGITTVIPRMLLLIARLSALWSEAYLWTYQTTVIECFCKKSQQRKTVTIFTKWFSHRCLLGSSIPPNEKLNTDQERERNIDLYARDPVGTGRKLNVHKTLRRRPGRLLNVFCTFNLRPVSTRYGTIRTNPQNVK